MSEPALKKPRSEAQIAAFEKARKAREDNLRKKFQAEAVEKAPATAESTIPEGREDEDDDHSAASMACEPGAVAQKDEHEYIDFDPESFRNELYEKLHAANEEIKALKEHVHGVSSKQEELQTSWHKHGVRTNNMLNFV